MEQASHRGPKILYGTAWKESDTTRLTAAALAVGFRGIDTANQRKHYFEAGVGEAVRAAIAAGNVTREQLFLQTKFTYARGQDHRLPYDPNAHLGRQVEQSFASSLEHLGTTTIDSYVLHGPWSQRGWVAQDAETWSAMEALATTGKAFQLGISNVSSSQLEELCANVKIPPAVVQNRCFASMGWDRDVRSFCTKHNITYQGFSLLTANREVTNDPRIQELATRLGKTVPQVILRFALDAGMVALTGTTDRTHMIQDVAVAEFTLDSADVRMIEECIG